MALYGALPFFKYRVASSAVFPSGCAGAFSCGLLAMLVSRGSAMLMEGIDELKNVDRRLSHWINLVSGFAAGILMGFNGFMWSQAVIVEVYTFSVLSLMAYYLPLALDLRSTTAAILILAAFLFGICLNNHQTLIVATMGIEILIMAVNPSWGGICWW